MKKVVLKAYGKVNLGLDVVRRRDDGYHEVRMIMQTVGLFDRLELKKSYWHTDVQKLLYDDAVAA